MSDLPPVALLAGGLATRMRPLTEKLPKSMLEVAGEPFIAHQLRLFQSKGISRIVICAGYLGKMIEEFVGDGQSFGLMVEYSLDGEVPLGTGGALRKALPLLGESFFFVYGDSWLVTDYSAVAKHFARSGKKALMTVFRNDNAFDSSNVEFTDGELRTYDKWHRTTEMKHIDWGLGMLQAGTFSAWTNVEKFDLADMLMDLVKKNEVVGFEVFSRFYEIGSRQGLEELDSLIRDVTRP